MKKDFASWKYIVLAVSLIIIVLHPLYVRNILVNIIFGIIGVVAIIIITIWYIIVGHKINNEQNNIN